jgi:hypothetical protein
MPPVTFSFSVVDLVGTIIVPVVLPLLVGLVTTRETNAGRKAILLAVLAAVASLCTQAVEAWQSGRSFDLWAALLLVVPTFVIAVATHYGIWKPTGASSALQAVGAHQVIDSTSTVTADDPAPAAGGVTAIPHIDAPAAEPAAGGVTSEG